MSRKIKGSLGERIFDFLNISIMFIAVILTLYPMVYILFASISEGSQLMMHTGLLFWPVGEISFAAYNIVITSQLIMGSLANTLFVVIVGTAVSLGMTCLGAYFLSRKNVLLGGPIMFFIVFTMFFRGGLVPEFLLIRNLGFINSLWGLIIPFSINTFNMIILRTAFKAIPDSMEESAKLDGAGHWTIMVRIMIPMIKSTIAVIVLYYAVEKWNAWFWASILIRDRSKLPMQVVLREILIESSSAGDLAGGGGADSDSELAVAQTVKYAAIIFATVPILFVYPYLQKYFVKGVMIGAIKG